MFPNHCAHIIHLVIIKPENKTQDFVFQKNNFFSLSLLACLFPSATQKNARHCLSQTKMAPHPLDSGKINWLSSLLKTTYASSIANVKPLNSLLQLAECDKKLASVGVGPSIGHTQHSWSTVLQSKVFVFKSGVISLVDGEPACSQVFTSKVTSLQNKTSMTVNIQYIWQVAVSLSCIRGNSE